MNIDMRRKALIILLMLLPIFVVTFGGKQFALAATDEERQANQEACENSVGTYTAELIGGEIVDKCVCPTGKTAVAFECRATASSNNPQLDIDCGNKVLDEGCPIVGYLVTGINVLTALAMMAIIGSIMIAGFQYMTARDNAGAVEASRKRIVWALTALFLLVFTYAFLQWVVPGGVL